LINYALGFSGEVWHLRRESDLGYKLFSGESQSPYSQTMHATIECAIQPHVVRYGREIGRQIFRATVVHKTLSTYIRWIREDRFWKAGALGAYKEIGPRLLVEASLASGNPTGLNRPVIWHACLFGDLGSCASFDCRRRRPAPLSVLRKLGQESTSTKRRPDDGILSSH
jgi:hypothetical protein